MTVPDVTPIVYFAVAVAFDVRGIFVALRGRTGAALAYLALALAWGVLAVAEMFT